MGECGAPGGDCCLQAHRLPPARALSACLPGAQGWPVGPQPLPLGLALGPAACSESELLGGRGGERVSLGSEEERGRSLQLTVSASVPSTPDGSPTGSPPGPLRGPACSTLGPAAPEGSLTKFCPGLPGTAWLPPPAPPDATSCSLGRKGLRQGQADERPEAGAQRNSWPGCS